MTAMELATHKPLDVVSLGAMGADIARPLAFREWDLAMRDAAQQTLVVYRAQDAIQFGVGDLLLEADRHPGWEQQVDQTIMEAWGTQPKSKFWLDKCKKVANRVPRANRVPGLTFYDHEAVASLSPEEQPAWLAKRIPGPSGEPEISSGSSLRVAVKAYRDSLCADTSESRQDAYDAQLDAMVRLVERLREMVCECGCNWWWPNGGESEESPARDVTDHLDVIVEIIRDCRPCEGCCPGCEGLGCEDCRGTGFLVRGGDSE